MSFIKEVKEVLELLKWRELEGTIFEQRYHKILKKLEGTDIDYRVRYLSEGYRLTVFRIFEQDEKREIYRYHYVFYVPKEQLKRANMVLYPTLNGMSPWRLVKSSMNAMS